MILNPDNFCVKLAQLGLENKQYFNMNIEEEFWMFHFLQKYKPLCQRLNEKYNSLIFFPEMTNYCFFVYLFFQKQNQINFFNLVYFFYNISLIESISSSSTKNFILENKNKYQNLPQKELNKFYKKVIKNYVNINTLDKKEIDEILDCYNLKVKFISRASKFVNLRK